MVEFDEHEAERSYIRGRIREASSGMQAEIVRLETEVELLRTTLQELYDATSACTKHECAGLRNGDAAAKAASVLARKPLGGNKR